MTNEKSVLTTELVLGAEDGDSATVKNLPASVLQALYREFTGRTESLIRSYDDNFVVEHEDVRQLIERLIQYLGQYQTKIADIQLVAKYLNGASQSYSSLARFNSIDKSYPEKTKSLELIFSFLISTPGVGTYQNYRIVVLFNSYYLSKDKLNLMYGRNERDKAIELKIEYVDYVIAMSINSVFDDWLKTIVINPDFKTISLKILNEDNYRDVIQSVFIFSSLVVVFSSTFIAKKAMDSGEMLRWQVLGTFAIVFATYSGKFVYSIYESKFWSFGKFPFLVLNKTDYTNMESFLKQRSSRQSLFRRYLYITIGGILTNIMATIFMILVGLQKL